MKSIVRTVYILGAAALLAGCNQTTNSQVAGEPQAGAPIVASDPGPARVQVAAATPAQPRMQDQPAIYEPLVDLNGKSRERYARDHAACREMAEPQERVAREAMQREQAGAALQVAGAMAGFLPVGSFRAAQNVATASSIAQDVGANVQAGGAATAASAREDYALVVNNCLSRRGYYLLRT
jgi:hypothetical protein